MDIFIKVSFTPILNVFAVFFFECFNILIKLTDGTEIKDTTTAQENQNSH